jgi:hypothetical protein
MDAVHTVAPALKTILHVLLAYGDLHSCLSWVSTKEIADAEDATPAANLMLSHRARSSLCYPGFQYFGFRILPPRRIVCMLRGAADCGKHLPSVSARLLVQIGCGHLNFRQKKCEIRNPEHHELSAARTGNMCTSHLSCHSW